MCEVHFWLDSISITRDQLATLSGLSLHRYIYWNKLYMYVTLNLAGWYYLIFGNVVLPYFHDSYSRFDSYKLRKSVTATQFGRIKIGTVTRSQAWSDEIYFLCFFFSLAQFPRSTSSADNLIMAMLITIRSTCNNIMLQILLKFPFRTQWALMRYSWSKRFILINHVNVIN